MNCNLFIQQNGYNINKPINPTPQEYLDKMVALFNKHSLQEENVTSSQWKILQEIIDNKTMIEEKLKPLSDICKYTLNIVGGSLRDILIGKENEINDYDIVISTDYPDVGELLNLAHKMNISMSFSDDEVNNIKRFRRLFAKEQKEVKGYGWDNTDDNILTEKIEANYYFSKIVNKLMSDSPNYQYYSANNVREKYLNAHITSINQFTGVNNKKVDLIVSEYSGQNFTSTFDFELCKISADIRGITTGKQLLNNIIPTGSMLRDMEDNTLSVNPLKFPKENLEYFFHKHLLKLIKKYPDYKVNLFTIKPIAEFTLEEKERWIFAHQLKMEVNMPEKGYDVKKNKI